MTRENFPSAIAEQRAKRTPVSYALYVVGDFTEGQYDKEKEAIEKLIDEEARKIAPPAYGANERIAKVRRAGAIIAESTDPTRFKLAVSMFFERLEVMRQDDGSWKIPKVIPKEELREFF